MKILLVKTSSMGDIIHTLPALTDARKALPDISFDWVVEENFAEIPAWHEAVDKVIPVAIRRWRRHLYDSIRSTEITKFIQSLKSTKYDYVIDVQGLFKSAIIAYLAQKNTNVKCGYAFNSAREPFASLFYDRKYVVAKDQHAITRIRQLFAAALNYKQPLDFPDYGINVERVKKIASESENITHNGSEKYLVFVHSSSRSDKLWTESEWVELASLAVAKRYKVKLIWGNKEEWSRANRIANSVANVDVLPQLKLSEIADLFLDSSGVVAVDTGLGHLAAALNVKTISLYGPTDPKLIGTWGKNQSSFLDFTKIKAAKVWEALGCE